METMGSSISDDKGIFDKFLKNQHKQPQYKVNGIHFSN